MVPEAKAHAACPPRPGRVWAARMGPVARFCAADATGGSRSMRTRPGTPERMSPSRVDEGRFVAPGDLGGVPRPPCKRRSASQRVARTGPAHRFPSRRSPRCSPGTLSTPAAGRGRPAQPARLMQPSTCGRLPPPGGSPHSKDPRASPRRHRSRGASSSQLEPRARDPAQLRGRRRTGRQPSWSWKHFMVAQTCSSILAFMPCSAFTARKTTPMEFIMPMRNMVSATTSRPPRGSRPGRCREGAVSVGCRPSGHEKVGRHVSQGAM